MTTTRDISWGADCDRCDTRLNADRAAECLDDDGSVICGSCRDEERYENRIAELEAEVKTQNGWAHDLMRERDAALAAITAARRLALDHADHEEIWRALYVPKMGTAGV